MILKGKRIQDADDDYLNVRHSLSKNTNSNRDYDDDDQIYR